MNKKVERYRKDRNNYMRLVKRYRSNSADYKNRRIVKRSLLVAFWISFSCVVVSGLLKIKYEVLTNPLVLFGAGFGILSSSALALAFYNQTMENNIESQNMLEAPPTKEEVRKAEEVYVLSRVNKKY